MSGFAFSPQRLKNEELFQVILQSATSSDSNDFRLVPSLDELSSRNIDDPVSAVGILLQVANSRGSLLPDVDLVASPIAKMSNADDKCLRLLIENLQLGRATGLLVCAPRIIAQLSPDRQNQLVPVFVSLLVKHKDNLGNEKLLINCVPSFLNNQVKQILAKEIDHYLGESEPNLMLAFVMAAQRLSERTNSDSLLKVLENSTKGWYPPHTPTIQSEICSYLCHNPDPRAAPTLLMLFMRSFPQGYRQEVANAIAAVANGETVDKLLDIIEAKALEYSKDANSPAWQVVDGVCRILSETNPTYVDVKRLLRTPGIFRLGGSQYYIKQIIFKGEKQAKPLLLDLLKSRDASEYSFAAECLNQMGVTLDEMASSFDPPPVVQLIRYFFPNASPTKLWDKKEDLGSQLKSVGVNSFDFFVHNLLNSFNLVTIYVDKAGKKGVDIVGVTPNGLRLVVAGVTSGNPKDDLPKLQGTLDEMKASMPDLMGRYELVSLLFTKVDYIHPSDLDFAQEHGIIVLKAEDVKKLLEMSSTGRTFDDMMRFLENKRRSLAM